MLTRILTGLVGVPIVVWLLHSGGMLFNAAIFVLAAIGWLEFYNMAKSTSSGFCTLGMVTVIEKATGLKKFTSVAESKDLEKYQALHTDQVNVVDITTGSKMRVSTSEFKNNGNCELHRPKGQCF